MSLIYGATLKGLINAIYPEIENGRGGRNFFSSRAILAARNKDVEKINAAVLDMVPGASQIFISTDKVDDEDGANVIPFEFLNSLEVSGWPPHRCTLNVGTPVMLLRNLDPSNGLCNGTKLIVHRCSTRVIEAEVLTGDRAGSLHHSMDMFAFKEHCVSSFNKMQTFSTLRG